MAPPNVPKLDPHTKHPIFSRTPGTHSLAPSSSKPPRTPLDNARSDGRKIAQPVSRKRALPADFHARSTRLGEKLVFPTNGISSDGSVTDSKLVQALLGAIHQSSGIWPEIVTESGVPVPKPEQEALKKVVGFKEGFPPAELLPPRAAPSVPPPPLPSPTPPTFVFPDPPAPDTTLAFGLQLSTHLDANPTAWPTFVFPSGNPIPAALDAALKQRFSFPRPAPSAACPIPTFTYPDDSSSDTDPRLASFDAQLEQWVGHHPAVWPTIISASGRQPVSASLKRSLQRRYGWPCPLVDDPVMWPGADAAPENLTLFWRLLRTRIEIAGGGWPPVVSTRGTPVTADVLRMCRRTLAEKPEHNRPGSPPWVVPVALAGKRITLNDLWQLQVWNRDVLMAFRTYRVPEELCEMVQREVDAFVSSRARNRKALERITVLTRCANGQGVITPGLPAYRLDEGKMEGTTSGRQKKGVIIEKGLRVIAGRRRRGL